jgi:hypothetical protein
LVQKKRKDDDAQWMGKNLKYEGQQGYDIRLFRRIEEPESQRYHQARGEDGSNRYHSLWWLGEKGQTVISPPYLCSARLWP